MANTQTLVSGPWQGVKNTTEPFDDTPEYVQDAFNGLFENPAEGSGFYARPGVTVLNASSAIGATSTTSFGNEVYTHTQTDGTLLTFAFSAGKMYRLTSTFEQSQTPTDVTPANVTFRANGFIYCTSLGGKLIVSDETAKPMLCTNLTSTPVTATPIEYGTPATLLSRGSTDTKVANATFINTAGTVAANAVGTALPAGTIPLNTWGVYRVTYTGSTYTVTAGAANFTAGYATEALAKAAVPSVTGQPLTFDLGYFTVQTKIGTTFVGGTDALTGGASGNVANATNYYAGEGNAWSALGRPTIYTGALFFIVNTALGASVLSTIVWSEPNQPDVGYAQTNYDNQWTLTQTGTTQIYAIIGKNDGLYYSRVTSWGVLVGAPGVNFRTTATHDTVSYNVGCVASKTVQLYGDYIFFADAQGRAWRFQGASEPQPLWQNMRAVIDANAGTLAMTTANIRTSAWGVVEPSLNLYILATYLNQYGAMYAALRFYVFDLRTGNYQGYWSFNGGAVVSVGAQCYDTNGSPQVLMVGDIAFGTTLNCRYVTKLSTLQNANWLDNNAAIVPSITTNRLGYSLSSRWTATQMRAVFGPYAAAVSGTMTTPYAVTTLTDVTPPATMDSVTRGVWNPDKVAGRGMQVNLSTSASPAVLLDTDTGLDIVTDTGVSLGTGASRWIVYRIEVDAVASIETNDGL